MEHNQYRIDGHFKKISAKTIETSEVTFSRRECLRHFPF